MRNLPAALLLSLALVAPAAPLSAQAEAQQLIKQVTGQQLTQDQILERLRTSGISREDARNRLRAAGYDPGLVDAYYERMEGRSSILPDPDRGFLAALADVGFLEPATVAPAGLDTAFGAPVPVGPPPAPGATPAVFGLDVFARATEQFEPVTLGPVDPDYRLGPGDQIVLIVTGDVELAYSLDVTREGFIVVPDVGQVSVNGLTMEGLRDRLYDRLGQVYSGVRRSADASTRFDVSLGRLRTNHVFVIGDVMRPGAYQISSVGTVLTALYRGGGPTPNGSFRRVSVHRGGAAVADVDLYDYLIHGDAGHDVRLRQGDVVFVPPAGPQVTVEGQVRRPAIYELRPGETLAAAIRFAGGVLPDAHLQRVQVDRILPPSERRPGRDRVLLDADAGALTEGGATAFPLEGGDRVTVYGVLDRQRGRVTLSGAVWRPGAYEFRPGMTVADLIRSGDGLRESAFRPVAHVRRLEPETGMTRLLRVPLSSDGGGRLEAALPLEDLDEVTVFDEAALRAARNVEVLGEVVRPGRYALDHGASAEDLILAAGGLTPAADPVRITVSRARRGADRSDTLTVGHGVFLSDLIPTSLPGDAYGRAAETPRGSVPASEFHLEDGDQIIVRRLSGWIEPYHVFVRGEVAFPGAYAIESRGERLSSILGRSGGLTRDAYAAGVRLMRDSMLVAIDLPAALARPGSQADVPVRGGDEIIVPQFNPAVLVSGSVTFPVMVAYKKGWGVKDYLGHAGGAAATGDLGRLSVEYPNGTRAVAGRLLFFKHYPRVEPGSRIFVPAKPTTEGTNWDQFLTRTLSITTTLITVLVAANQLK